MRTIKFRAWDGEQMCEWRLFPNPETENDISYRFVGEDGFCYPWEHPDLIKIQFTGLLDKNGKEIYEGDIVKIRTSFYNIHNEDSDHDKTYTGEVVLIPSKGMCLKKPNWYCWITDSTGKDKLYKSFSAYKSEVIGNIHQNPNLL